MTDVTEKMVRDRLLAIFPPLKNVVAFNIGGVGPYGHEIDFLRITASGYAQEFEIKVTKADIKNELTKMRKHDDLRNGALRRYFESHGKPLHMIGEPFMSEWAFVGRKSTFTHMHARYSHPIKEFYIAIPSECNLLDYALEILPEWMGICEFRGDKYEYWLQCLKRPCTRIKGARKITEQEMLTVYRCIFYKFWALYRERGGMGRGTKKLMAAPVDRGTLT